MLFIFSLLMRNYQLILIGAVVAFVSYLAWDYQHTKAELTKTKRDLTEQKAEYAQFQQDFNTYKQNVDRLDSLSQDKERVVRQQNSVKERMNSVPVTKNDHPFGDPGLLGRARIMRDYQNSRSPVSGSADATK